MFQKGGTEMGVIYCLIGFILGALVSYLVIKRTPRDGTLRVDRSDPTDEPYLFLEGIKSPYEIAQKRFVIFDVKRENYISHE